MNTNLFSHKHHIEIIDDLAWYLYQPKIGKPVLFHALKINFRNELTYRRSTEGIVFTKLHFLHNFQMGAIS
jgi:hypothetical protein